MIFKILSKIFAFLIKLFHAITFYKMPLIATTCAIIEKDGKYLVQLRNDSHKYCLPGGLTKAKEDVRDCITREVLEETGITIKNLKLYDAGNILKKFPYVVSFIFIAEYDSGNLKNSWEGKACWKTLDEMRENMAFDHEEILVKYKL